MAVLTYTRLETHPDGTTGANGIVNGNWERLELIFDPTMTSSDPSFNAALKMLIRSSTLPATNGASLQWDEAGSPKKLIARAGIVASSSATPALDFKGGLVDDITLTGDATFTATNQAAGWQKRAVVRAGGSLRNLTFPAWTWIGGAAPAAIASGKVGLLELIATGTNPADVLARWTVQP